MIIPCDKCSNSIDIGHSGYIELCQHAPSLMCVAPVSLVFCGLSCLVSYIGTMPKMPDAGNVVNDGLLTGQDGGN